MKSQPKRGGGRMWSLGWVILIRLILCLVIVGFFLQYIYFDAPGRLYRPGDAISLSIMVFLLNLAILTATAAEFRPNGRIIVTFILDLAVLTWIILASGGLSSVFIPYYLPTLAMAPASLPRRYTAIFPSIATLGAAYISLAHLLSAMGEQDTFPHIYPIEILRHIRFMPPHTIVATLLVLTVVFFIVSYLSGMIGHRYFSLRERMEAAERNLERFSAVSTMAAGLAHEIRNPLASLRSAIQEIGESFPEGSQNRTLTDIVMAESDRLDRIIGRFLDFSREGRLRLSRTRLGGMLEDVRTLILRDPNAGDLQFTLDIRDDPEVECDGDRLKEVFFNLALNAAQEVTGRKGKLVVRLSKQEKGIISGVEILFMDNGPGIDEDEAGRLFEPFFTDKTGGTGMGLPLSRKHIVMHNGEIEAGNNPGGGARFRVWVPLEQSDA